MKPSDYENIGQYLSESRESLNVTLEEAAEALRIRAKYLRAIESGNLDELPGQTYLRGYIKNYAAFLRLNQSEVMEAYSSLFPRQSPQFFIPEPPARQNLPTRRLVGWSVAGIALLYGLWYGSHHETSTSQREVAAVPEKFMRLLDKAPRRKPALKAWQKCPGENATGCIIAMHSAALIPDSKMFYHVDITDIPSQEP